MHPTDFTLNEYIDGELAGAEQTVVAQHLTGCTTCRTLVSELEMLKRSASRLGPMTPRPQVRTRIEQAMGFGRLTMRSSAGPLATAALLLLATLVGVRFRPGPLGVANPAQTVATSAIPAPDLEWQQAETEYETAITGLQEVARAQQDALDEADAATLWESLALIDVAIGENRAALAVEPESQVARRGLMNGLRFKISLLENTVSLIAAARPVTEG